MIGVKVEITKFVDNYQPGIVECQLVDAWGIKWVFIEKIPIVTLEELDETSLYPRLGIIACQVIRRETKNDSTVVTINTDHPWYVESTTSKVEFEVLPEQLIEFELEPS